MYLRASKTASIATVSPIATNADQTSLPPFVGRGSSAPSDSTPDHPFATYANPRIVLRRFDANARLYGPHLASALSTSRIRRLRVSRHHEGVLPCIFAIFVFRPRAQRRNAQLFRGRDGTRLGCPFRLLERCRVGGKRLFCLVASVQEHSCSGRTDSRFAHTIWCVSAIRRQCQKL